MDIKIVVETKSHLAKLVEQLQAGPPAEEGPGARRKHWRLKFATPGSLAGDPSLATNEPVYMTTHDISAGGVGFLCRNELEPGQRLVLLIETDIGDVEVPGIVRHCTATVGMYKVGIEFDLIDPVNN